jgi:hypothetical protein
MRWNLSLSRQTNRPGYACVLAILLVVAAGPAVAQQSSVPDIRVDLGTIGLGRLSGLSPSMVYRPFDTLSGRPGADALGMGGAHLASASGTMALGWNTSGLADLERLSFAFDGYNRGGSGSTAGYPDSLNIPGIPTFLYSTYDAKAKGGFVPNFLAAAAPLWKSGERRLVAAFGWWHYAELGTPEAIVSELRQGDNVASFPLVISSDRSERGSLESFTPAVALRLGSSLSVGASVNVLDGRVHANSDVRLPLVGASVSGGERVSYRYSGVSPEVGARASLGSRVSLGLRFAPGYSLKVREGTYFNRSLAVPPTPRLLLSATMADYDLKVPSALGVGLSFRPAERLLLAADVNTQSFSKAKVEYRKVTRNGVEQPAPDSVGLPLEDVTSLHFGAEYRLFRTCWGDIPVRLGFHTSPLGYRNPTVEDMRVDTLETAAGRQLDVTGNGHYHGKQPTVTAYSFGVSLDTPGIRYDLGFESASYDIQKWFFDTPWEGLANPKMDLVTVSRKVTKLRLSATYTF